MSKYRFLLFDADNTLFDFTKAEHISFMDTCFACNITYSEELYRKYSLINDRLWKRLEKKEVTLDFIKVERFRELLCLLDFDKSITTQELIAKAAEMRDTYMSKLGWQTWLIDGAEEICQTLSQKYDMYIVTNGVAKTQHSRFDASSIKKYFNGIFISEEIGFAKPDARFFEYVMRETGGDTAARDEYLVIGDSPTSDYRGALNAGLDMCLFSPAGTVYDETVKPAYTIMKLSELYDIL